MGFDFDTNFTKIPYSHTCNAIEKIVEAMNFLNIDSKHLYFEEITSFENMKWYVVYLDIKIDLPSLNIDELQKGKFKEKINYWKCKVQEWIAEGNIIPYFEYYYKDDLLLNRYKSVFFDIPDHEQYDAFIYVYSNLKIGVGKIDNYYIEKALSKKHLSNRSSTLLERLEGLYDSNGYLVIYRGAGKPSSPLDETLSWTLDFYQAIHFAKRIYGRIYQAKVHYSKVIEYITELGESEILVYPSDVLEVKMIIGNHSHDAYFEPWPTVYRFSELSAHQVDIFSKQYAPN
ncbi:MAG: hypothetical protein OWR52_14295 [Acidibacillus sp.]|nr:hypothetical protein [Acidibacillus sp.]